MKVAGSVDPSVPPFIGLAAPTQHAPWADAGQTGFLGSAYGPFKPTGPDMANMVLNVANKDHLVRTAPLPTRAVTSSANDPARVPRTEGGIAPDPPGKPRKAAARTLR